MQLLNEIHKDGFVLILILFLDTIVLLCMTMIFYLKVVTLCWKYCGAAVKMFYSSTVVLRVWFIVIWGKIDINFASILIIFAFTYFCQIY